MSYCENEMSAFAVKNNYCPIKSKVKGTIASFNKKKERNNRRSQNALNAVNCSKMKKKKKT